MGVGADLGHDYADDLFGGVYPEVGAVGAAPAVGADGGGDVGFAHVELDAVAEA